MMVTDSFFAAAHATVRRAEGFAVEPLAVLSLAWGSNHALLSTSLPAISGSPTRGLSAARSSLLLPDVLSAFRNTVPRDHVHLQCLLRQVGPRNGEARADGGWAISNWTKCKSWESRNSRTSHGSTCSTSIPAPTAAGARITAQPIRWAGHCRHGLSPSRQGTTASSIFRCFGAPLEGNPLIGSIYSEDEIWSCTTCGACEEECPLLVEYIDKIVDLRRGMIDEGNVPQSLQKPLGPSRAAAIPTAR